MSKTMCHAVFISIDSVDSMGCVDFVESAESKISLKSIESVLDSALKTPHNTINKTLIYRILSPVFLYIYQHFYANTEIIKNHNLYLAFLDVLFGVWWFGDLALVFLTW